MKLLPWILWPLAAVALISSMLLAWIALATWGDWTGFPLVIRLAYFTYFLLCATLIERAIRTDKPRTRLRCQLAMIASAPLMAAFVIWANR